MITRICDVPCYFDQRLQLSGYVDNLRIILKLKNSTGDILNFSGVPPVNTFQVWITYYTDNAILAKENTSTAFNPELTSALATPTGFAVSDDTEFEYDIKLTNLHYEKPNEARYWSISFRVQSQEGVINLGETIPIVSIGFTGY
jgi:hypothetical protein